MSRAEFLRWHAFHRRNPIDPHSLYIRPAALIAQTIAASQAGDKAPTLERFLECLAPTPEEDEGQNLFDQLKRHAMRATSAPG